MPKKRLVLEQVPESFEPKIRVKLAGGATQFISPNAFQQLFGVEYLEKLVIDKSCPKVESRLEEEPLRKIPGEHRRGFLEQQFVKIRDSEEEQEFDDEADCGGEMKRWLYGDLVRKAYTANIYIAKVSDSVGYGAFAGEDFTPGQMLAEYTGIARKFKKSDLRNPYTFNYVYNAVIDASKAGNVSRFINHSESGANARYMRLVLEGIEHVILLAKSPIAKDEQILFDYGAEYWQLRNTAAEPLGGAQCAD